ncbi:MAG: GAF domain-containing protein, partial [Chloroflexi bacterium]
MQNFFAPPIFEDEEKNRIARIQNAILLAGIGMLIVLTGIRLLRPDGGFGSLATVNIVLLLLLAGIKLLLHRGYITTSSVVLVSVVWIVLTLQAFSADGIRDTAFYSYIVVIILAFALLNWQAGAVVVILSIVSGFVLANAEEQGWILPGISRPTNIAFDVAVLFGLSGVGLGLIITGLNAALKRARRVEESLTESNRELKLLSDTLEDQVAIRIQRLEMLTTVNEHLSAILNLDELIEQVVTELEQKFNYRHAYIYMLDDAGQTLVAAAGIGPAAAQLVAQQHRVPVDAPVSLMARAVRTRQIVQVSDVRQAPDWLPNPHLADTRSELAVPIVVSNKVIGVLDVQSTQVSGFDDVDVALMRLLANHVAVAVNNALLFRQVETSLAEAQAIQQQYLEQAWNRQKVTRQNVGRVRFSLGESTTLDDDAVTAARHTAF